MTQDSSSSKTLNERKKKLQDHLSRLNKSLQQSLSYAFDRYYETEVLTYLKIEEKIDRFETLFLKLSDQINEADNMALLRQSAGRFDYLADLLDELEAVLYRRPRRRRRASSRLSDFFSRFSQKTGNGSSSSKGEISSLTEAYQALDLEEGVSMSRVTSVFRRLAKKYHPDAHGGDRSSESSLRRVVEAYQMIKGSHTE
ncbi:MAG: DnaJ domain-containing protein [Nitrospira sp.]